jgi:hypothetical protein
LRALLLFLKLLKYVKKCWKGGKMGIRKTKEQIRQEKGIIKPKRERLSEQDKKRLRGKKPLLSKQSLQAPKILTDNTVHNYPQPTILELETGIRNVGVCRKIPNPLVLLKLLDNYIEYSNKNNTPMFLDSFCLHANITRQILYDLKKREDFKNCVDKVYLTCSTDIIKRNYDKVALLLLKSDHFYQDRQEIKQDTKIEIKIKRDVININPVSKQKMLDNTQEIIDVTENN